MRKRNIDKAKLKSKKQPGMRRVESSILPQVTPKIKKMPKKYNMAEHLGLPKES